MRKLFTLLMIITIQALSAQTFEFLCEDNSIETYQYLEYHVSNDGSNWYEASSYPGFGPFVETVGDTFTRTGKSQALYGYSIPKLNWSDVDFNVISVYRGPITLGYSWAPEVHQEAVQIVFEGGGWKYGRFRGRKTETIPSEQSTPDEYLEALRNKGVGFYSDSIYAAIDPHDAKSYYDAFILDAERHGLDMEHYKKDGYFQFSFSTQTNTASAALGCSQTVARVRWNETQWNKYAIGDVYNLRISRMWHELGHAVFGAYHLCKSFELMTSPQYPEYVYSPDECNQGYITHHYATWGHANPDYNWQRMRDDFFAAYKEYLTGEQSEYYYATKCNFPSSSKGDIWIEE